MTVRAAVAGASGYAGGEVLRLLLEHPEVEIGAVTAGSNAGTRLGDHQPHLQPLADRVLEDTTAETLSGHDVVFLALPHGHSAAISAELGDAAAVVDLAADHRLTSANDWQHWYGSEAADPWPYGLPELSLAAGDKQREHLRGARRIAVPGCHPTVGSLALAPAMYAGLVEPDVTITNITGTSGAGKSLKPHLLGAEVMGSLSGYGVGGTHRHTPEFMQNLGAAAGKPVTVAFTPILAPLPRGILTTATAPIDAEADPQTIRKTYEQAYADEPFVHLLPEGQWPTTAATVGSNNALLQVTVDQGAGKLVVIAAIDNLTKGTAGAAVQCMNLAVGLDETLGLPRTGVAP